MNLDVLILFILLLNSIILLYVYFNLNTEKELLELILKNYFNSKDNYTAETKSLDTLSDKALNTEAVINSSNFIEVDP